MCGLLEPLKILAMLVVGIPVAFALHELQYIGYQVSYGIPGRPIRELGQGVSGVVGARSKSLIEKAFEADDAER